MGMVKKDLERQEEEQMHSEQNCECCGDELTKDDVEYNKLWGEMKLCQKCRTKYERLEKELRKK